MSFITRIKETALSSYFVLVKGYVQVNWYKT